MQVWESYDLYLIYKTCMSKRFSIFLGVMFFAWFGWWLISYDSDDQQKNNNPRSNQAAVTQQGDRQLVKILARGGYSPNLINAIANKDTTLEVETRGTYDCSSSISIPALRYRKNLPATGVTQIKISAAQAMGSMEILCSMGMYRTTIKFGS